MDYNLVRTRLPDFLQKPCPEIYLDDNYVVLDFETTNKKKGTYKEDGNSIVLAAWLCGPGHKRGAHTSAGSPLIHRKFAGEYDLPDLVEDIKSARFIVAHSAKFELGWLARCGLDISRLLVWDTLLGEYVIGGNRWQYGKLSLEQCAKRNNLSSGKLSVVSRMIKAGICPSTIPRSWLEPYCALDVLLCWELFLKQRELCHKESLLPVVFTRCILTPVLVELERSGLQLDAEQVVPLVEQKERELAQITTELERFAPGLNWSSPPQVREFLYEDLGFSPPLDYKKQPKLTDTGLLPTDADTVKALRATNARQREFQALFAQQRSLNSELTKYLRKFKMCCEEGDGLLLVEFNQTNTQTHRLSSTGAEYSIQGQNLPREYKSLFKSRYPDWLVGEADEAQLEFRAAAHLGRDPVALKDIMDNVDVHTVTASIIYEDESKRTPAKAHTFKPLYGGRSGTPEERRYYEFFREKYAGITNTQDAWINEVLGTGKLVTECGLAYYWPDTKITRTGYITNTTSICNYPVQGFATAEIVPVAVVYLWHYIRSAGHRMFLTNTVHDSAVAEIPPEEVPEWHTLSQICLLDEVYTYLKQVYNIDLCVPLGCGVSTGTHWGSKDETKYEAKESLWQTSATRVLSQR